jgi:DNA-directed RNA polymerase specialized sigma24 family protein
LPIKTASQIVELKSFAGLSAEEIGEVLSISPATVQREWRAAKAWLRHTMASQTSV